MALSTMLDLLVAETPNDKASIEAALDEIAAAAPTSTAAWQSLAEMRKARGAPIDSVLAAFRMSALTGSHEGFFMMQRATFGLAALERAAGRRPANCRSRHRFERWTGQRCSRRPLPRNSRTETASRA